MKKRIITFSRRTDGGLYIEWLIDKIKKGFCYYPNPYTKKLIRQSLRKEDIIFLSLWTKAPERILPYLNFLIDSMNLNFQITLTGYGNTIEKNISSKEVVINSFREIADKIKNPKLINWRYDPIFLSYKFNIDWHINNFYYLCSKLKGYTNKVIISPLQVVGNYLPILGKMTKNRIEYNDRLILIDKEKFFFIVRKLREIAIKYDIKVNICCEPSLDPEEDKKLFEEFHDLYDGCLSYSLIKEFDPYLKINKSKGQRKNCLCLECRDIGVYYTCFNGCVYCYANRSKSEIKILY